MWPCETEPGSAGYTKDRLNAYPHLDQVANELTLDPPCTCTCTKWERTEQKNSRKRTVIEYRCNFFREMKLNIHCVRSRIPQQSH